MGGDVASKQASCHVLSDDQRDAIADILGEPVASSAYLSCEGTPEDPGLTCFLAPESWLGESVLQSEEGAYLCMNTPTASNSMNSEDSY